MYQITTERPEDGPAIELLLDQAFGANRQSKISYRYREGVAPATGLSLVARTAAPAPERPIGSLRFWPVAIGPLARQALLLGPLAVTPDRQGHGIGGALVRQGLDMATWARHRLVLLVGDLAYYGRFGFRPAAPLGLVMPDECPERLLACALAPGALAGVGGVILPWRTVRRAGSRAARAA